MTETQATRELSEGWNYDPTSATWVGPEIPGPSVPRLPKSTRNAMRTTMWRKDDCTRFDIEVAEVDTSPDTEEDEPAQTLTEQVAYAFGEDGTFSPAPPGLIPPGRRTPTSARKSSWSSCPPCAAS
jgi:hypothetical protein